MNIDLNADLGEGFGPYRIADDEALMGLISSANVACGYHAGDPVIMARTARLALAHGVDLGAHVSYPDLMGFGRRAMQMDLGELEAHVLYQMGALQGIATAAGHRVTHMNPHGALGNLACADPDVAEALVRACAAFDRDMALLVLSGTALDVAARKAEMRTVRLFLADRAYAADGQLVPRRVAGSVITDEAEVVARVERLLDDGTIFDFDGNPMRADVQSILVHSDTPGAVALARRIRDAITSRGGSVAPLSRLGR